MIQKTRKTNLWNVLTGYTMRGLVFGGVITPTKSPNRRFNRTDKR
ncbi:MAG: hypothetical protein WC475_03210 [Candidatus Paceibacterota bacterium]